MIHVGPRRHAGAGGDEGRGLSDILGHLSVRIEKLDGLTVTREIGAIMNPKVMLLAVTEVDHDVDLVTIGGGTLGDTNHAAFRTLIETKDRVLVMKSALIENRGGLRCGEGIGYPRT